MAGPVDLHPTPPPAEPPLSNPASPPPHMRQQQRDTAWAVGVAALVAAAFYGLPLLGARYVGFDLTLYTLPMLCALDPGRAMDGPWLSLALGNAVPLFAEPGIQLLYPFRWLGTLFAPDLGASLEAVVHLAGAAGAAAFLARTLRMQRLTAALAGAAYALAGPVADLVWHGQYIVGAVWTPLAWACARTALRSPGRWWAPATALALALCLLGGEPQAWSNGCVLVVGSCWAARKRLARCVRVLLAPLASLCAAAVQLLPMLAHSSLGGRSGGWSIPDALRGSILPEVLPALVLPGAASVQVGPGADVFGVVAGEPVSLAPWSVTPYLGLLLLGGVVAALAHRRTRSLAALALGGLLVSAGKLLPVMPLLLAVLPPLRMFRYPMKYLVPTSLLLVMVLGLALETAARSHSLRRQLGVAWLAAAGCLLLLMGAAWSGGAALDALAVQVAPLANPNAFPSLSSTLLILAARGLAAALAGVAFLKVSRLRPWSMAVLVVDLALAAAPTLETGAPLADQVSPAASLPRGQEPLPANVCVDPTLLQANLRVPGTSAVWSRNLWRRLMPIPPLQACDGITSPITYTALQTATNRALEVALEQGSVPAARAFGCRFLIMKGNVEKPGLVAVPNEAFAALSAKTHTTLGAYALEDPVLAAQVVPAPHLVEGTAEVVAQVLAAASSAGALAVVDDPFHQLAGPLPTAAPDVLVAGVQAMEPGHVKVGLSGRGGALVVLRVAFGAGFHAVQAGRELGVLRAAGQHVAIPVEDVAAGPVELQYRAPRLWLGVGVSLAGVCVILLLAWWNPRRRAV